MKSECSLIETFVQTLRSQPEVVVHSVSHESGRAERGRNSVILADVLERPVRLLVVAKASGYPRDVRNVSSLLRQKVEIVVMYFSGQSSGFCGSTRLIQTSLCNGNTSSGALVDLRVRQRADKKVRHELITFSP